MSSVVISGDTSGAITLAVPAVAGTNTITLPASTGTVLTTASTGVCVAWVNFNGTTATPSTIRSSYNVTSVTKNATGNYTVNYTTALNNSNYAPLISTGDSGNTNVFFNTYGGTNLTPTAPSTTACGIKIVNSAANALVDAAFISFAAFSS